MWSLFICIYYIYGSFFHTGDNDVQARVRMEIAPHPVIWRLRSWTWQSSRLVFRYRYLAVPINDVQLGAKVPDIPYTNRTVWWSLVVMLFLFVMVFAGGRMSGKCWVSSLLKNILCRYHTSESTEPMWYVTCTCMNNLQYRSFQFAYLNPRFGSLFGGVGRAICRKPMGCWSEGGPRLALVSFVRPSRLDV